MVLLGAWYGLSANDINFGTHILSRRMHDLTFQIYAQTLGVEVSDLPGLFVRALIFDSILIGCFVAYRKRAILMPKLFALTTRFMWWFESRITGPVRLAKLSPLRPGLHYGLVSPVKGPLPALPARQQTSTIAHPTT